MDLSLLTDSFAQLLHLIPDLVKHIQKWEVHFKLLRDIFEFYHEQLVCLVLFTA